MVRTDVEAVVHLCSAFVPGHGGRGAPARCSTWRPPPPSSRCPARPATAPSKAFVLSYTQAHGPGAAGHGRHGHHAVPRPGGDGLRRGRRDRRRGGGRVAAEGHVGLGRRPWPRRPSTAWPRGERVVIPGGGQPGAGRAGHARAPPPGAPAAGPPAPRAEGASGAPRLARCRAARSTWSTALAAWSGVRSSTSTTWSARSTVAAVAGVEHGPHDLARVVVDQRARVAAVVGDPLGEHVGPGPQVHGHHVVRPRWRAPPRGRAPRRRGWPARCGAAPRARRRRSRARAAGRRPRRRAPTARPRCSPWRSR